MQQWLRERAAVLLSTYIACLVNVKPGGTYSNQDLVNNVVCYENDIFATFLLCHTQQTGKV
jgi:hypothetical protein